MDDSASQSSKTKIVKHEEKKQTTKPKVKNFNSLSEEGVHEIEENEIQNKNIESQMGDDMNSYLESQSKVKNTKIIENDFKIDEIYSINNKNKTMIEEIHEIIDKLNNDSDLNFLIDSINKIRLSRNSKIFDKNQMLVSFNGKEVDKFFTAKKQHPNFSVDISFQLI